MAHVERFRFSFSKFLLVSLALMHGFSLAQNATSATKLGLPDAETKKWAARVDYDLGSDFADSVKPRVVTNRINTGVVYDWGNSWKTSANLQISAATVNGQIYKDKQQSFGEVLAWRPSVAVSYGKPFLESHRWSVSAGYYLPIDELTRLEGYQGVLRLSGRGSFRFFSDRLAVEQKLSVSNVINSYRFNTLGRINPDHLWIYEWENSLRLIGKLSLDFAFGMKLTRYLDDSWLYNYNNSIGLSYEWKNLFPFISYENGGFTEDGKVNAWFIDRYRRIFSAGISATF